MRGQAGILLPWFGAAVTLIFVLRPCADDPRHTAAASDDYLYCIIYFVINSQRHCGSDNQTLFDLAVCTSCSTTNLCRCSCRFIHHSLNGECPSDSCCNFFFPAVSWRKLALAHVGNDWPLSCRRWVLEVYGRPGDVCMPVHATVRHLLRQPGPFAQGQRRFPHFCWTVVAPPLIQPRTDRQRALGQVFPR